MQETITSPQSANKLMFRASRAFQGKSYSHEKQQSLNWLKNLEDSQAFQTRLL